jgi:hypothetical protein
MNPTEIEQINREFATEVMGWHEGHGTYFSVNFGEVDVACWVTENNEQAWTIDEFDPYHHWDHAAMALEKFETWVVEKLPDKTYQAAIWENKYHKGGSTDAIADTALPQSVSLVWRR